MTPLVPPFGTRRTGYLGRQPARRTGVGESPTTPDETPLPTVTHYAAPTAQGTGDGSSEANAFQISDFLALPPSPGDHCELKSGTVASPLEYTGANSIINPAAGVDGTEADRIVISCATRGGVRINGEGARRPITLSGVDYWWLDGMNCHNSDGSVVGVFSGSRFNIIRKVMAWDASSTANGAVFSVADSWGNLVEDCAGFGNGRRIFQSYNAGDGVDTRASNVFRRCWGMGRYWEGSTKKVWQIGYQGYGDIAENCVGTFDAEGVLSQSGTWRGIFCFGRIDHQAPVNSDSKVLGSIGYIRSGSDAPTVLDQLADGFGPNAGGNEFRDVVFYTEEETVDTRMVRLQDYDGDNGTYADITEVGDAGGSSAIATGSWDVSNREVQTDTEGSYPSPFQATTGAGARVYYRYVDGVLQDGTGGTTATTLWPWPMDARIRAALTTSGRDPDAIFGGTNNTLTDLMESIFGTIPGI